jgi:hypothetical protein
MAGRHRHTYSHRQGSTSAFLAGDIILFASTGDVYSKVARWLMKGAHEGPTYTVHTGQFLDSRRVLEMDMVVRITTVDEMLTRRYRQGPWRVFPPLPPLPFVRRLDAALNRQGRWKHRGFEVWRCPLLTAEQRRALTREALRYVHVRFGFLKAGAHLLDNLVSKLLHRDVFLFRHIDPEDRRPVCSGISAAVYDKVLHYRFGVDPECADPDHIHDWVRSHPGEWERVFRREPVPQARTSLVVAAGGG